ncbi:MAG: potassium/proton antiporter, partial [Candidatus Latescibacterota bacterium]
AIVSSTDAAAVFAILRSRGVGLKGHLKPILEAEASSNDAMAVLLTLSCIGLITNSSHSWMNFIPFLVTRLFLGVIIGAAIGYGAGHIFNWVRLRIEGLYPVLSLSIVLLSYGLSELLNGNGFLAVYATGIVWGNMDFPNKRYLVKFHDGIGWLMQVIMFLVLGLLVFPSRLPMVALSAMLVSVFLMFVARPIAVYLSLLRSSFTLQAQTLIAWTGLKGSVPIILATFPFMAGYKHSEMMFDMVFFIVLSSVFLQGTTMMLMARWLKVDEPLVARPHYPISFEKTADVKSETREIDIPPDVSAVGRKVSELGLSHDVRILLIMRDESFIAPRGDTRIEAFDTLLFMGNRSEIQKAKIILLSYQPKKGEMF